MATDRPKTAAPPVLWPYLLLCAGTAVWIDLGSLHQCQHADSLLPVHISLYRWTLFYWDSDRIGMLIPFLARPIDHPLANLLFQDALNVFSGLAAFFLLARYFLRDATYPLVAAVAAAGFLTLPTPYYRFEYLVDTYYGLWLSLGLSGLLLLEPRADGGVSWSRRFFALAMLLLAHWVYCTAFLFLGPLVVCRLVAARVGQPFAGEAGPSLVRLGRLGCLARRFLPKEAGLPLLFLAASAVAGFLLMRLAPARPTSFGALPMQEWPLSLKLLLRNTVTNLGSGGYLQFLSVLGASAVFQLVFPSVRRHAGPAWRAAGALTAAGVALALFMATREWVSRNEHMFRFLLPSCLYLQAAVTIAAIGPVAAALSQWTGKRPVQLSPILLLIAVAWSYGKPSLQGVRQDLAVHHYPTSTSIEPLHGIAIEEVIDARCTHIAGAYWQVWPAVFSANLALRERGEQRIVWGISLRSRPTRRFWSHVPLEDIRVAVPVGDPQAEGFLKETGLPPLVVLERRTTFLILRPQ